VNVPFSGEELNRSFLRNLARFRTFREKKTFSLYRGSSVVCPLAMIIATQMFINLPSKDAILTPPSASTQTGPFAICPQALISSASGDGVPTARHPPRRAPGVRRPDPTGGRRTAAHGGAGGGVVRVQHRGAAAQHVPPLRLRLCTACLFQSVCQFQALLYGVRGHSLLPPSTD
jgi:hypothetical protein